MSLNAYTPIHEWTDSVIRLYEIKEALEKNEVEQAKTLVEAEIYAKGKFAAVQQRVQTLYPEFVTAIAEVLAQGKITKLMWQIGYCIKLGMAPIETAKILNTNNRSVSTLACKLRRLELLEAVKKA
ncbi:hypothetical protein [Microscilla marina]|uniref:Uncharacterized protein n=1 Tax=Microscilla marina ATCC 23134 TaxID=313606 RepID=A1ZZX4_MICM2|nr:hypothetical protein [Microscilla marina]EAY24062.1 hypothetical protein M23134_01546 [Microscilla marina ATCC 23134]